MTIFAVITQHTHMQSWLKQWLLPVSPSVSLSPEIQFMYLIQVHAGHKFVSNARWCSCKIGYWDFHFRLQVMKCRYRPEQFLHHHWHSHWKLNSLWLAYHFSSRELLTTETELVAMAILAIHGCRVTPMGTRNPAAIGIPMRLYTTAQMKFIRILLTVRLERSMAATTSIRLSCRYRVVSIT